MTINQILPFILIIILFGCLGVESLFASTEFICINIPSMDPKFEIQICDMVVNHQYFLELTVSRIECTQITLPVGFSMPELVTKYAFGPDTFMFRIVIREKVNYHRDCTYKAKVYVPLPGDYTLQLLWIYQDWNDITENNEVWPPFLNIPLVNQAFYLGRVDLGHRLSYEEYLEEIHSQTRFLPHCSNLPLTNPPLIEPVYYHSKRPETLPIEKWLELEDSLQISKALEYLEIIYPNCRAPAASMHSLRALSNVSIAMSGDSQTRFLSDAVMANLGLQLDGNLDHCPKGAFSTCSFGVDQLMVKFHFFSSTHGNFAFLLNAVGVQYDMFFFNFAQHIAAEGFSTFKAYEEMLLKSLSEVIEWKHQQSPNCQLVWITSNHFPKPTHPWIAEHKDGRTSGRIFLFNEIALRIIQEHFPREINILHLGSLTYPVIDLSMDQAHFVDLQTKFAAPLVIENIILHLAFRR